MNKDTNNNQKGVLEYFKSVFNKQGILPLIGLIPLIIIGFLALILFVGFSVFITFNILTVLGAVLAVGGLIALLRGVDARTSGFLIIGGVALVLLPFLFGGLSGFTLAAVLP